MNSSKKLPAVERKGRGSAMPPAAGRGRTKGVPNKVTTILKEAIIEAAIQCGNDGKGKDGLIGYCRRIAEKDMKAFSTLLGKVLPTQITGDDGKGIVINIQGRDSKLL